MFQERYTRTSEISNLYCNNCIQKNNTPQVLYSQAIYTKWYSKLVYSRMIYAIQLISIHSSSMHISSEKDYCPVKQNSLALPKTSV